MHNKISDWKKVSTLELGERFDQLSWDGIDEDTILDDALEYFVTKVSEVLEDLIPEKKKQSQCKNMYITNLVF